MKIFDSQKSYISQFLYRDEHLNGISFPRRLYSWVFVANFDTKTNCTSFIISNYFPNLIKERIHFENKVKFHNRYFLKKKITFLEKT